MSAAAGSPLVIGRLAVLVGRLWWPVALVAAAFTCWWVQLPGHYHTGKTVAVAPPGMAVSVSSGGHPLNGPESQAGDKMKSVPGHPLTSLARPIGPNDNTQSINLTQTSAIESTCQSVPGAQCVIEATKAGRTITMSQPQTISTSDITGVILNWSAGQLSAGTWSIKAVATFQGQAAVSDSESLTVTDK